LYKLLQVLTEKRSKMLLHLPNWRQCCGLFHSSWILAVKLKALTITAE